MCVGERANTQRRSATCYGSPANSTFTPEKRGLPRIDSPGCGMWGSMLNELTNHSQPQRVFSLRSRLYPIGHDPLPCCAASADASQLNILLFQCRILRKERRHREPAGSVGDQEISCFPLGTCKRPLTTGSGRQAGRLGSLLPGTDWVGTPLTCTPPLLSTRSRFGRLGLTSSDSDGDLIYPPLFPWLRRYGSIAFFFQRGRGVASRTGPLPFPMQPSLPCGRTFRSWRVFCALILSC